MAHAIAAGYQTRAMVRTPCLPAKTTPSEAPRHNERDLLASEPLTTHGVPERTSPQSRRSLQYSGYFP